MTVRLAQISDTHLSPRHPAFTRNFEALAAHLASSRPDLVVNTGDLSAHGELPGEAGAADLEYARALHQGLGVDWLAVPGNHDVGNDPALAAANGADAERVERWNGVFGADRFRHDLPGWRLIGLNTLIAATEMAEAQFDFLAESLAGAGSRRIGLFLHKPLCVESLDEDGTSYWHVLAGPRRRIAAMLRGRDVAFLASGHVHQWRDRGVSDGLTQIWAPSVAFVVGDAWQDGTPFGEKPVGYLEHRLHPDGRHEHALIRPEGMQAHDLGTMPEAYGPLRPRGD